MAMRFFVPKKVLTILVVRELRVRYSVRLTGSCLHALHKQFGWLVLDHTRAFVVLVSLRPYVDFSIESLTVSKVEIETRLMGHDDKSASQWSLMIRDVGSHGRQLPVRAGTMCPLDRRCTLVGMGFILDPVHWATSRYVMRSTNSSGYAHGIIVVAYDLQIVVKDASMAHWHYVSCLWAITMKEIPVQYGLLLMLKIKE